MNRKRLDVFYEMTLMFIKNNLEKGEHILIHLFRIFLLSRMEKKRKRIVFNLARIVYQIYLVEKRYNMAL